GYVRMLDEREGPVAPEEVSRAFSRKSVWRRYAIVAAGPIANFLLAIVLYWGLFASGTEELRPTLALTEAPQTIAASAGVRDGDLVVAVDGEAVRSWSDLRWILLRNVLDGNAVTLRVRTAENVEAFRQLDFDGVSVDEGRVDLIERIGLRPWRPLIPPVVGQVMADGAADRAGIADGDRFISLANEPVDSWVDLVTRVRA